jgi:hypothetical protein
VLALACLIVLGLLRPAVPHIASLTGPLTTSEVERFIFALAWLLALALAIAVFVQALRLVHRQRRPQVLVGVLPRPPAATPPRRARDGASARYVLTIAAPAPVPLATASELPAEPAPQAEQVGEAEQREVSIAVLGPLAVDGLAHKVKRAATYELLAYLAFHPAGASRDELTEQSGRDRTPSARVRGCGGP